MCKVSVLFLPLLLAGCSLAPRHTLPEAPLPVHWEHGEQVASAGAPASAAATLEWQAFVTDETLRRLVSLALENNRDLRQALLNVEAARAQYRVQRADRAPTLDVQGSASRQRLPGDLSATGAAQIQSSYQAGIGVTAFELDLFGRVRNLSQSALQEYLATDAAARGARISLVSAVIQAYVARESARQRHALTADVLRSREESLQLTERRRRAGAAAVLDVQEALTLREEARVSLERTERELRQAGNALGLLVGVADLRPMLPTATGTAAPLLQQIAAGAPSELLAHRPDILAAEHRLRARNADIGAARAAFLPSISLTGLFGSSSAELSNLFDAGQRTWSFAPQLVLPIFDGGRNRAGLDLATVRKDIAVAEYERVIQVAFREVSDALAATDTLQREEAARRALAEASAEALRLSEARYRAGLDDHLRYLEAQRSDFANRSALMEIAAQRQSALAELFKALGGGWPE